jgi:hypothetical protein
VIQPIGCCKSPCSRTRFPKSASDPAIPQRSLSSRKLARLCSYKDRSRQIALVTQNVTLMVKNPGDTCAVTQFAENRQTLFVPSACLRIVRLGFHDSGAAADRASVKAPGATPSSLRYDLGGIASSINFAHAASAQRRRNLIGSELCTCTDIGLPPVLHWRCHHGRFRLY